MRLLSWNVNGLRACIGKGFLDFLNAESPDCLCLQETKLQAGQLDLELPGYKQYWNYAEKKGYSGTAVFTRQTPLDVRYGIGVPRHDTEGRVITLEFERFYLVTVYTPNSQDGLRRLEYRMDWEDCFREYLCGLDREKCVAVCGDMNVAHEEIDLKNPDTNHMSAGFTDEERGKLDDLLACGFSDSFRSLYPDREGAYSWWSYRTAARSRNAGWRIDYFLLSERMRESLKDAFILDGVLGSDHCPVGVELQW